MKLYIFRHGETYANAEKLVADGHGPKAQLTELGRQQAMDLGKKLAPLHLPMIYSSPYDRALQTASYVAAPNQTPIKIVDGLHEFSFGKAEGLSEKETFDKYPREFQAVLDVSDESNMQTRMPGGENKEEALQRFIQALNLIAQNCSFPYVGVASHGHIMNLYHYHLYGREHPFANCEVMEVEI